MERTNVTFGAPWEDKVGYCRAVKVGNIIEVSGTAPVRDGETVGESAYDQARICLEIIQEALEKVGAGMEDVVRTRMFVTDISQWEAFGRAHGEFFGSMKPATTMVEVTALIDPKMLIEIEATAVVN